MSDLKTLHSTKFADIELNSNYLKVVWKYFANDEEFTGLIVELAKLAKEHEVYKTLIDARKFRGTSVESRTFVNEVFNKLAEERGKHITQSLVLGEDATGRFSLNKIVKDSEGKGKYYRFFSTVEEAEAEIS
jgi:hypothetical protein